MKQLKIEELELINSVYQDLQKQVVNPLHLNQAFKLISDETENYLLNKRAKILTINRFMQFQYENQLNAANQLDVLDTLFDEKTYVDEDLTTDTTQTNVPDDQITVSPTKIVNKQKPKPRHTKTRKK